MTGAAPHASAGAPRTTHVRRQLGHLLAQMLVSEVRRRDLVAAATVVTPTGYDRSPGKVAY